MENINTAQAAQKAKCDLCGEAEPLQEVRAGLVTCEECRTRMEKLAAIAEPGETSDDLCRRMRAAFEAEKEKIPPRLLVILLQFKYFRWLEREAVRPKPEQV